jgi:transposase-like protein
MDAVVVEGRRRRRTHSAEFKARVMQACSHPGVSIASVALSHGLNANLVRRWLNGRDSGSASVLALSDAHPVRPAATGVAAAFVPVQLATAAPSPSEIRLELHRGAATAIVNWPARDAVACGNWLCEWLR